MQRIFLSLSLFIDIYKPHKVPYKEHIIITIDPISQKSLSFFEPTVSPFYMAKSSSISLIFILVLVCSTPAFEARKVLCLKKGEVSSMEESFDLASLPKGPTPHSSRDKLTSNIKSLQIESIICSNKSQAWYKNRR